MAITQDAIVEMARAGYDEQAIAERFELTYDDIRVVISQALRERSKQSQTAEAKAENLQRIIDGYFTDLSEIAALIDAVPTVDWRVKAMLLGLKNSVRNSLFKVLQETDLIPHITREGKQLSGWEELMQKFIQAKKVKLTQSIEVGETVAHK